MEALKLCTRCGEHKARSAFSDRKRAKDGKQTHCKACYKQYYAENGDTIRTRMHRKYYADHEQTLANQKEYKATVPDKIVAQRKRFKQRHPERIMLANARDRATKYGVPFSIVEQDIVIPDTCPVLGIPIYKGENGRSESSPSLDRIIPEHGYVKGNIAVISDIANRLKNDGTANEHRRIASWMTDDPVVTGTQKFPRNLGMLVRAARKRARKAGIACTVSVEELLVPDRCPILGIPIIPGRGRTDDNSPSLDRRDPNLGYVPGNVFVVSWRANRIKNDGTADQHRRIADWMDAQARPKSEYPVAA